MSDAGAGAAAAPSSSGAASAPAPVDWAVVRALAASGRQAMVIAGVAYDFTDFVADHPGGPEYLRKNAGKDATEECVAARARRRGGGAAAPPPA